MCLPLVLLGARDGMSVHNLDRILENSCKIKDSVIKESTATLLQSFTVYLVSEANQLTLFASSAIFLTENICFCTFAYKVEMCCVFTSKLH